MLRVSTSVPFMIILIKKKTTLLRVSLFGSLCGSFMAHWPVYLFFLLCIDPSKLPSSHMWLKCPHSQV